MLMMAWSNGVKGLKKKIVLLGEGSQSSSSLRPTPLPNEYIIGLNSEIRDYMKE